MRISLDGKFYRERRGKLVEIPTEWLNKIPTSKTMRDRPSRLTNKDRRNPKYNTSTSMSKWLNVYRDKKDIPIED